MDDTKDMKNEQTQMNILNVTNLQFLYIPHMNCCFLVDYWGSAYGYKLLEWHYLVFRKLFLHLDIHLQRYFVE